MIGGKRSLHRLPGPLGIESAEALHIGFDYGWNGVIAYHAMGFTPPQGPYGEISLLVVLGKHAVHERIHHFRIQHRVEGVCRAVGVPEGEGGIKGLSGIGDVVRLDVEMIETGVDILFLLYAAFDLNPR